jgi:hypothetical protein
MSPVFAQAGMPIGGDSISVSLIAACDDAQLLGFPLKPDQRRRLQRVEAGPRTHVWSVGRRGLKTTSGALVGLWCCLLRPELLERLRPGERGYAVGVATSLRQSRLLVSAARSIVERSPLLAPFVESVSDDEILFANGTAFAAFPCTSRGGRGWPVFALVMDEAAHFVDGEGNAAAEPVFRALVPATAQFGDLARIVVSSTPWGAEGWFSDIYQRAASGELEDAYAHHATTAEANPAIDAAFLAAEERRDPESFRSEYLAEFVGSGGAFFDPENVAAAVTLPGELRPDDATHWIAGLDPAFSSDPFGLVLVGRDQRDRRRLLVGLVRSWRPPSRKPASLDEGREIEDAVLAEVAQVVRLFGARAVTDQYRSAGVVERLRRYGISVRAEPMTAPTKDAAFGFLRGRLNEGSLDLFEHADLQRELRAIRTRYTAGRSSVVTPRIAGGHCDLAQALAIAVFEHDRYSLAGPGSSRAGAETVSAFGSVWNDGDEGSSWAERFGRHSPRARSRAGYVEPGLSDGEDADSGLHYGMEL